MSKPTKYYSSKQENAVAGALGWSVVSGSGAAPCVPGDVISDEWLGECKTHTESGKRIFFDYNVWEKIEKEANMKHRKPVLIADDGSQDLNKTWCVCPLHVLNLSSTLTHSVNFSIRKNISFDGAKEKEFLQSAMKGNIGGFYDGIILTADWGTFKVAIMQFNTFKEIFDR